MLPLTAMQMILKSLEDHDIPWPITRDEEKHKIDVPFHYQSGPTVFSYKVLNDSGYLKCSPAEFLQICDNEELQLFTKYYPVRWFIVGTASNVEAEVVMEKKLIRSTRLTFYDSLLWIRYFSATTLWSRVARVESFRTNPNAMELSEGEKAGYDNYVSRLDRNSEWMSFSDTDYSKGVRRPTQDKELM